MSTVTRAAFFLVVLVAFGSLLFLRGCEPPPRDLEDEILPHPGLVAALQQLELTPTERKQDSFISTELPQDSAFWIDGKTGPPASLPLQAADEIVIQLQPDATPADVGSLLQRHRLKAIKTIPQIGIIVAAPVVGPISETTYPNVEALAASTAFQLMEQLESDPIVQAVAPNAVLGPSVLATSVRTPTGASVSESRGEIVDWGLIDIRASSAGDRQPRITLGVVDINFTGHADLRAENGMLYEPLFGDHGTHVAGIACAKHNGAGVRGVLTDCSVKYATGTTYLSGANGTEIECLSKDAPPVACAIRSQSNFSELVGTVIDFLERNEGVKVLNLSVGYNWRTNFNIDPLAYPEIRDLIRGQGRMALSILAYASKRGVVIFSSAGNDSQQGRPPLSAIWGSPINFAARLLGEGSTELGWRNIFVVEAHDRSGRRAEFSNIDGNVSCPGVDIQSLASPDAVQSRNGTSMASPYCAAAFALVRAKNPRLSWQQVVSCFAGGLEQGSGGAGRVKIDKILKRCASRVDKPSQPVNSQLVGRLEQRVGTVPNFGQSIPECPRDSSALMLIRDTINLGDGLGPELDSESREIVTQYSAAFRNTGCAGPIYVVYALPQATTFAAAVTNLLAGQNDGVDIILVRRPVRVGTADPLLGRIQLYAGQAGESLIESLARSN